MNREADQRRTSTPHIGTAEMSLAMWLRNGRAQKSLSLEDVARITKIQPRILERLEAGRLDGLPAEVFVRGFVRSFARCVGLDEAEALRRYVACAKDGTGKAPAGVAARAVIDAMGDLAPNTRAKAPRILHDEPASLAAGSMEIPATPTELSAAIEIDAPVEITFAEASEVISVPVDVETSEPVVTAEAVVAAPPADMDLSAEIVVPEPTPAKKKRVRKAAATDGAVPKRRRSKVATGTPSEPTPIVAVAVAAEGDGDGESDLEPIAAAESIAPKRRRKPRGSVQPPIIEAVEPEAQLTDAVIATEDLGSEPAPISDVVAIETTSSDGAIAIESIAAASSFIIDAAPAASSMFDSSQGSEVDGEIEAHTASDFAVETTGIEVVDVSTTRFERVDAEDEAPVQLAEAWTPRMPPFPIASSPGWRRSPAAPSLVAVIDDADPEGAERALEDRRRETRQSDSARRTFLPPILLDRDGDRSARQGGLTLAVIILLIAATLTLSYLMRRPSAAGDGVTQLDSSSDTRVIG